MNDAFWTIENNIISVSGSDSNGVNYLNSAVIRNNLIYIAGNYSYYYGYPLANLTNCNIINNILVNTKDKDRIIASFVDNTYHHNVISSAEDTNYPNNLYLDSNDLTTIFTMTGSNDQQYMLCENSPAKGYATDGGDCGPYGSGYTYVPGGLPLGMPYYTEATIGSMAHDGKVTVTLKISAQDE